jgi:hypothetical protein
MGSGYMSKFKVGDIVTRHGWVLEIACVSNWEDAKSDAKDWYVARILSGNASLGNVIAEEFEGYFRDNINIESIMESLNKYPVGVKFNWGFEHSFESVEPIKKTRLALKVIPKEDILKETEEWLWVK